MILRSFILFIPAIIGTIWLGYPEMFLVWSVLGSFFIAGISQTKWFREEAAEVPLSRTLLRPATMFQVVFVGFHVIGGACHTLDVLGYSLGENQKGYFASNLPLTVEALWLMLLGQAGVTAGMKLSGFAYGKPRYVCRLIKPPSLLMVFLGAMVIGELAAMVPGLGNLGAKIAGISLSALLVACALSLAERNLTNIFVSFGLLAGNLVLQTLSGWKGLTLWTMLYLTALVYPLAPGRVVSCGIGFLLFWTLVLHPFGMSYRELNWGEQVSRSAAAARSAEDAAGMSFQGRVDNWWTMMVIRANELYQFKKYIETVPSEHPYYDFEILTDSLLALIPRIIWPDKPDLEELAMERVHVAGIVDEDTEVSAKSNFFQDAYLSGGWVVIVAASLIFGVIAMWVSRLCEQIFGGYLIGTGVVYTGLFASTFNFPPGFVFFVGSVWTSLLVLAGLFLICKTVGVLVPRGSADSARWKFPVGRKGYVS